MSRVYITAEGRRVRVSPGLFAPYVKADFASLELLTVNLRARCTALVEITRRKQRGRLIPAKMLRTAGFKAPFDSYQEVRDGLYKWTPLRTEADKFFELWLNQAPDALSPSYVIAGPLCSP